MLNMYQDLTRNATSPNDEISREIKSRIQLMLETQDPDIIIDMRKTQDDQRTIFDIFWNEMEEFFNEVRIFLLFYALKCQTLKIFYISKTTPAVHDRWHTNILYMPLQF